MDFLNEIYNRFVEGSLAALFIVLSVGLLLGRVRIKGMSLGSSGVLFIALLAGHLGWTVPAGLGSLGLVLFVYCIGLGAGDRFFAALRRDGLSLALLSFLMVLTGGLVVWGGAILLNLPAGLAAGLFAGALTSTPALGAASEVLVGQGLPDTAVVGYGMAYPFGVLATVLFIQFLPRIARINLRELEATEIAEMVTVDRPNTEERVLHPFNVLLMLSLGLALGVVLGLFPIPFPGGSPITIGLAGGPLVAGLIFGHFFRTGRLSNALPSPMGRLLQELGLVLFLAGAGTAGGGALFEMLRIHGVQPLLLGMVATLLPLLLAWPVARFLRMEPLQALGGICGGMTSSPALGVLAEQTSAQTPIRSYVTAYPAALVMMLLASRLLIYLLESRL